MRHNIRITGIDREEPDLDRLSRALLELARRQLDQETAKKVHPKKDGSNE